MKTNIERFGLHEQRLAHHEARILQFEQKLNSLEVTVARMEGTLNARNNPPPPQWYMPPSGGMDYPYQAGWMQPPPRRGPYRQLQEDRGSSSSDLEVFGSTQGTPVASDRGSRIASDAFQSMPTTGATTSVSLQNVPASEGNDSDVQAEHQKVALLAILSKMNAKQLMNMISGPK